MSIPSGIIRFAGTWSVTHRYIYAELVISPVNSSAYVLVVNELLGGTDPSVPSANWVLIPSSGGGPQVYQATYYKSVQQNLISPNTDITFDEVGAWNNDGGYITHTNGTADFTVVQTGLYQLEFNIGVNANGATWNNTSNKAVAIDITRAALGEQAVIQNNALTAINTSYQQAVASSFYLEAGDIINLRNTLPFATATPFAVGVLNTFDLNTFFTWVFIS